MEAAAMDILGYSFEEEQRGPDADVEGFCDVWLSRDGLDVSWTAGSGVAVVAHKAEQRRALEESRGEVGEQVARHPVAFIDDWDLVEVAEALDLPAAGGAESETGLLRCCGRIDPEDVCA